MRNRSLRQRAQVCVCVRCWTAGGRYNVELEKLEFDNKFSQATNINGAAVVLLLQLGFSASEHP